MPTGGATSHRPLGHGGLPVRSHGMCTCAQHCAETCEPAHCMYGERCSCWCHRSRLGPGVGGSKSLGAAADKDRSAATFSRRQSDISFCGCGAEVTSGSRGPVRRTCDACRGAGGSGSRSGSRAEVLPRPCSRCGVSFEPARQNQKRCPAHVGKPSWAERRHWPSQRDRSARRRAAMRRATVRPVNRWRIFERDGWICKLCGRPVDPKVAYPDPLSHHSITSGPWPTAARTHRGTSSSPI
jgi:hypothetical protein